MPASQNKAGRPRRRTAAALNSYPSGLPPRRHPQPRGLNAAPPGSDGRRDTRARRGGPGGAATATGHHQPLPTSPNRRLRGAHRAHSLPARCPLLLTPSGSRAAAASLRTAPPGRGCPGANPPFPCHDRARPRRRADRSPVSAGPAPSGEGASRALTEKRGGRPAGAGGPGSRRRAAPLPPLCRRRARREQLTAAPPAAPRPRPPANGRGGAGSVGRRRRQRGGSGTGAGPG